MFLQFSPFSAIYLLVLHLTLLSPVWWLCLSLPINQTGFPHSQVTHNNDLRDLKSAEKNKRRNNKCQWTPHPESSGSDWFKGSPHSASALLLAGSLHFIVEIVFSVLSCLLLEILHGRKKKTLWGHVLLHKMRSCLHSKSFYLRELSNDTVPSNRRKNAHGWNSDWHEALG